MSQIIVTIEADLDKTIFGKQISVNPDFEAKLRKYAELLVRVGINVQPKQRVFIYAYLADHPEIRRLVHYAVAAAYDAGARLVDVQWRDEQLTKIRLEHAADDTLSEFSRWRYDAQKELIEEGGAELYILTGDPDLLKGQDSNKIATMNRAARTYAKPNSILSDQGYGMWSLAAVPMQKWADKMLPDIADAQERMVTLWELIFDVCRINTEDPVEAWRVHAENLIKRGKYLTARNYASLKMRAPGTDLTIGLPQGHIWVGGGEKNNQGIWYMPNIPTEEVFTMPHRMHVNGTVKASMPLSYSGSVIEDFSFTFRDGRVVDYQARVGQDSLKNMLELDENAVYPGEVALAPSNSPIAKTGRLFYESLFDENAANHIALGSAFRNTLTGGAKMSDDEFVESGGNDSITHVDFMVGSNEMDVDGITADGTIEPLMRGGEWAFEVE